MHFQIHNGSRDPQTRITRAQRPAHGGLKQFILNGTRRLLRGRPVTVTLELLTQHIEELRAKEKEGTLYVTTLDGRVVNLYDDRLPAAKAPPAANPRPNPPLDSAANDDNSGQPMNAFRQEAPPPAEFTMPVEPPIAAVENNPTAVTEAPPAVEETSPAPDLTELAGLEAEAQVTGEGESAPEQVETSPETQDEQVEAETTEVEAATPAEEDKSSEASSGGKKKGKKGR